MCIQLLLVSGLLSAFGFPFLLPREFLGFTSHFWCQEWDSIPLVIVVHTLQTQLCNTPVLIMATKDSGYDS